MPTDQDAAAAQPTIAAEVAPVAPAEDAPQEKSWKKVLVVAGGSIPAGDKRPVIVVQNMLAPNGDGERAAKLDGYPTKGDLYIRVDPDVNFTADAPILTVGEDLIQVGLGGFASRPRTVHIGPAHPAWIGANVAWQKGAEEIEIVGLSAADKALMQPYVDGLAAHKTDPAPVKITVT